MPYEQEENADYTKEGFVIVDFGGMKSYASVNAEFNYDEDGIVPTGNYIVYLLHHRFGSRVFTLELNENQQWEPVDLSIEIEPEIIKIISDSIKNRSK